MTKPVPDELRGVQRFGRVLWLVAVVFNTFFFLVVIDALILHGRLDTRLVFSKLLGPILYLSGYLPVVFLAAIVLLAIALVLKRSPAEQACSFGIAARFLGLLAIVVTGPAALASTQAARSMAIAVTTVAFAVGPSIGYHVVYVHEGAGGIVMVLASVGMVLFTIFYLTGSDRVYAGFFMAYPYLLSGLLFLAAWGKSRKYAKS